MDAEKVIGRLYLALAQAEENIKAAEDISNKLLGQLAGVALGKLLPSQLHVDLANRSLTVTPLPPEEPVAEKKE